VIPATINPTPDAEDPPEHLSNLENAGGDRCPAQRDGGVDVGENRLRGAAGDPGVRASQMRLQDLVINQPLLVDECRVTALANPGL